MIRSKTKKKVFKIEDGVITFYKSNADDLQRNSRRLVFIVVFSESLALLFITLFACII